LQGVPKTSVTDYEYDNLRRPYKTVGPEGDDGRPTQLSFYDPAGNLRYTINENDSGDQIIEHEHDSSSTPRNPN